MLHYAHFGTERRQGGEDDQGGELENVGSVEEGEDDRELKLTYTSEFVW